MNFKPGQRWHSSTEPELGLGLIEAIEGRQIVISFPARAVTRRYAAQDPPLVRAQLTPGQQARNRDGISFCIEEAIESDGLFVYRGEGRQLGEAELDAELDVATPENRMRSAQVDDFRLFDVRHDALAIRHRMLSSPVRGLVGGRIRFFDHQLSIAHTVCQRHQIRVLLADEVGLGKTIEALLILHRLLLTGRIENALILVPPALVHQWLAEAYLRFNLVLHVIGDETYGGDGETVDADIAEQLQTAQLFVCPLGGKANDVLAQTPWDLAIVDEAHHLEPDSSDFALVAEISAQTQHVVLLSATPDRNGEAGHFHRLALLDPARFHDMDAYYREAENYRGLAALAERLHAGEALQTGDIALLKERLPAADLDALKTGADAQHTLLSRLLDLHGLGRVMFRNVRARIPGFPRRVAKPIESGDPELLRREFLADIGREPNFPPEASKSDPRIAWLAELLDAHPGEKVLVLCANRSKVEAFTQALATPQRKVARFHEAMGNIERDRQAAYFLDADGPQVVISSAIGAEGRNFQVARHLVLFDLPLSADRLEQAIGRVDRIGQGFEIYIYSIAVEGTPQARLRRWYLEALRVFERPWHGSPALEREFGGELVDALLAADEAAIEDLIQRGKARNEEIISELETGRDRLLELGSFDRNAAEEMQQHIAKQELDGELEAFMLGAFSRSGLDIETIGPRSYAVRAGMDYHHPLPGFVGDEMGVTFDRATALTHPERVMLTWDHPMVRDSVDVLLAHETGNASIAQCKSSSPDLILEALYVVETTLDAHLRADRFLPPTPVRIAIDMSGKKVDASLWRDVLEAADHSVLAQPQIGALLSRLLEQVRTLAAEQTAQIAAKANERMRAVLEPEALRLVELARVNSGIGENEIAAAHAELETLSEGIDGARARLDGLRLILMGAE